MAAHPQWELPCRCGELGSQHARRQIQGAGEIKTRGREPRKAWRLGISSESRPAHLAVQVEQTIHLETSLDLQ